MKTVFTIFLLFLSGNVIMVHGQSPKTGETKDWKTFSKNHVSIQYPNDWVMDKSKDMGTLFILRLPSDSGQGNPRANMNLLIQDLSGKNFDLDKFTDLSVGQIKTLVTNSKIIENKRLKVRKNEFQKVIYNGDYGIYNLAFEQYYFVVKDKAYVLTFTCLQKDFADLKDQGEKILNTFTVK